MEKKFEEELTRFYAENRRKDKIIVFQGMLLVILLVAGVLFLTYQTRTWQERITLAGSSTKVIKEEISDDQLEKLKQALKPRDGQDGSDGADGLNGKNGANGRDGANVTADQIAAAVSQYMRLNPVEGLVGATGVAGSDGLTQEITVTDDCHLLSRYLGSDGWSLLAILPKPCNP